MFAEQRGCGKEEPQGHEDSNGEPHQEVMQQVQREHCDDEGEAAAMNLKPCDDEKEHLQEADSNCMHCAMQKVMVEPIDDDEDVHEDYAMQAGESNPRPHMTKVPSCNVCDGFWDKKVEPTEEC